ncbi:Conserved_hypothetical protein [Hexamita inflata]|uniref:Uncharacterized protein n=1 Tax=Hexamita inflata TaxID=28002 RepID=A0AA86QN69_9EUKA|nr:Conserved hypothetical protein [Hexamita inflata]CAI9958716.1 Conserved hypothetical protein [Hexamita inflata]CAI9963051.1 Conserved hypothetical protein [Hexamita inflata]
MVKKEKKVIASGRPPFEYTPVLPQQYQRFVNLTVKLVSWSYLNFTVRVPITITLGAIKQMIINQNKSSLASRKLQTINQQSISDVNAVISAVTEFDLHIANTAVSSDIKLYKGSPLTFPPQPDDDSLTLEDIGLTGGIEGEKQVDTDLFYDFVAARIMGNGKVKF